MKHIFVTSLSLFLSISLIAQPSWIKQGNIYEVNIRQYTKEGTFKAFGKSLDRLKNMGVQTLWFMPLNPISKVDRKGSMGSYYAVADYKDVNPEFGTMKDFQDLVKSIHAKGMKVLIDWVPNHTGADHSWIRKHPEFYVKDSTGKPAIPYNWDDTRQLNFSNPVMEDSMISAMKYWVTNGDIDGFRVDVAWNVPESFWNKCIPQLRNMKKDFFMLAEGDKPYLAKTFDAVYPWAMFHQMEKIAAGERPAFALDSIKLSNDSLYLKNTIQMYFTSNHDENSWNKADYATFPGAVHAPFAVFTQTMANSVPLVYSGQEEPVLRPLAFFEKDPIEFDKFGREKFYKTLLELRRRNPALASDASFRKVVVGDTTSIYAYVREKGDKKIFVILNLSGREQTVEVHDIFLMGNPINVFTYTKEKLVTAPWKIGPWGYVVYEY
jgi:alpha-amylase